MIKNFLLITGFALLLTSCGNTASDTNANAADSTLVADSIASVIDINKFDEMAPNFVGKEITFEGTCVHTCKHGGARMHIIGQDPEKRVKVLASNESGKFNAKMEGLKFKIVGILNETRIDSAYIANWEAEILAGSKDQVDDAAKHNHGAEGDKATEAEEKEMQLIQVENMRKELKDSGKDHLSFYDVECKSFKEVEK
jgi:hypothetical protein